MCHMGQQKFTLHCPYDLPVRYHRGELFENVHYIQVKLKTHCLNNFALCVIIIRLNIDTIKYLAELEKCKFKCLWSLKMLLLL